MVKFYLLIQEEDELGHFSAWVRPVTSSDNIAAIIRGLPDAFAVDIHQTKMEASQVCCLLNKHWQEDGVFKWDYMPDGSPAPKF